MLAVLVAIVGCGLQGVAEQILYIIFNHQRDGKIPTCLPTFGVTFNLYLKGLFSSSHRYEVS